MPENNKSIGSEGLEQGGPNLGNDISRKDLSIRDAGDALTKPPSMGAENEEEDVEDVDLDDDELELDEDDEEEDDEDDKNL